MSTEIAKGTRVVMVGELDKRADGKGWADEGAWLVTTPMVCDPERIVLLDELRAVLTSYVQHLPVCHRYGEEYDASLSDICTCGLDDRRDALLARLGEG